MPTTESEQVEIENVVRLDAFERDILKSGAPVFAKVQTTEGAATVVFMKSCTWNSDTADEIQREHHMPGEVIFRLSDTDCTIHKRREVGTHKGAKIFLDQEH